MVGIDGRRCGGHSVAIRKIDDREPEAGRPGAGAKAVLSIAGAAGETRGVALVLHGGRADSFEAVRGRHLSPARMLPFARALTGRAARDGLAVWTLRNRYRGWNGKDMSPVQDARWALAHISREHPGVPVYLLGHSMGGLTALCVADHPQVEAVVALAPWLEPRNPGGACGRPPDPDRPWHRRTAGPAPRTRSPTPAAPTASPSPLTTSRSRGPATSCSAGWACGTRSRTASSWTPSPGSAGR